MFKISWLDYKLGNIIERMSERELHGVVSIKKSNK
jgi:hypothetical protein